MKDSNKWVIFPRLSNANHRMIEERNPVIGEDFSSYRFNLLHRENEESGKGIITHGINYESVMEALNGYQCPQDLHPQPHAGEADAGVYGRP